MSEIAGSGSEYLEGTSPFLKHVLMRFGLVLMKLLRNLLAVFAVTTCLVEKASVAAAVDFQAQVAPLLVERCLGCHNQSESKGALDLTRKATALKGGDSGAPIKPGNATDSLLWQRVANDEMPPEQPLSQDEQELLRKWIDQGADWTIDQVDPYAYSTETRAGYDWWSLQPLSDPAPPPEHVTLHPIDAFLRRKLDDKGLLPSPPVDRRTLIRRLSLKLLGMPPSAGQVDRFVADKRPDAYQRLIDETLSSPYYGQRWARHWLDLARFGESQGFERDKLREHSWPYRDWVINALNDDLPYDEFVRLQIAGDVIAPKDPQAVIATGFLVAGPYDEVGQKQQSAVMRAVVRQDEMEDYVGTVAQTFLGLTVNCARCHDHKFDPISQTEYYQIASALSGVRPGQRKLGGEQMVYAVAPQKADTTHVLIRGNPATPGEAVSAAGISALKSIPCDFGVSVDSPDARRRVALANWITAEQNPLFARVIVNRIWHYHFGSGIVATPSDFGFSGARPTHPELLDYLARRLIESNWSLKSIQRLIVSSQTYQQSSKPSQLGMATDATNRWLWRFSPQRLEAEAVRDSMLAVSGSLNRSMQGPSYRNFETYTHNSQFYFMKDREEAEYQRRTIYRMWIRSGRNQLLDALDCPDPSVTIPVRATTTTPTQTLSLLNNSFVLRMSKQLAERVSELDYTEVDRQVVAAYRMVVQRDPTGEELAFAAPFTQQHGIEALGRVLLNTNEFLFVE